MMAWIKSTKIGLRPMIRPGCKLRQLHHNHQISGYLKKLPSNHQLTKQCTNMKKDQWCYFWKIMSFWRQWFLGYLIEKSLGQSYSVKNANNNSILKFKFASPSTSLYFDNLKWYHANTFRPNVKLEKKKYLNWSIHSYTSKQKIFNLYFSSSWFKKTIGSWFETHILSI